MIPDLGRSAAPEDIFGVESHGAMPAAVNCPILQLNERLRTRQGTIMPDFDALYRRKAKLDNDHHPYTPKRCWPRFTLRTLFVVVTVAALA
jgi:hypothetical protein